jgi:hypothetical protein
MPFRHVVGASLDVVLPAGGRVVQKIGRSTARAARHCSQRVRKLLLDADHHIGFANREEIGCARLLFSQEFNSSSFQQKQRDEH